MPSVGAQASAAGVRYRVWAPEHARVQVAVGPAEPFDRRVELQPEEGGYFAGLDSAGAPGDRYRYVLDLSAQAPDVASRFQPEGVFGPSEVVDPQAYRWRDTGWRRPPLRGRVIYELHIGTFTPAGTYLGAIERLDHLAGLGVNAIEFMPLGDFPGRWNWGYDGVMLYAPARCYGRPDELRQLVDAAHQRGLAVIVDVVYNHFGPVGNPLQTFSRRYFHAEKESPWGQSLNFDGDDSGPVRRFFIENAAYWLDEYHVDGLRLDATHAVHDGSEPHLIAEVARVAAARGGFTIAEDDRNDARILSDTGPGAWGVDAAWADDFHHSVRVGATGKHESYFSSYTGAPGELADILSHGWLFRGQEYPHWGKPRGTACSHLAPEKFVFCISNHDQVGNRVLGDRLSDLAPGAPYRAASVLLCLSPYTPMIFMGQEWAAATPFLFFTDHPGEIGEKMAFWRRKEFASQNYTPEPEVLARMPDPQAESTFVSSHLDWTELSDPGHGGILELYRACLALRNTHAHFQNPGRGSWAAAPVGDALALRWTVAGGDWLLIVRLRGQGRVTADRGIASATPGRRWHPVLSSQEARFGGPPSPLPPANESTHRWEGPGAWLQREI